MTGETIYSERLGAIRDDQFAAALARFGLGKFVKASPTAAGLFGQNVFVTSPDGEFVLRGAPHWVKDHPNGEWRPEDRWQFTKEGFFARQLHERTATPVPWPYLHDESSDIFGWPYVLMPRMPGHCFNERDIVKALTPDDRRSIARALGQTLAEMQRLTWPFAGDFDTRSIALTPYPGGNTRHVVDETMELVRSADGNGAMSADDVSWIEASIRHALLAPARTCTYVHCDYKLNNVCVARDGRSWRVSGVFDLHEAHFGDGLLDIVRQTCSYLDTDPSVARTFTDSYLDRTSATTPIEALTSLYVINDRMKLWAHFTKPGLRAAWTTGRGFRGWAERYLEGVLELVR